MNEILAADRMFGFTTAREYVFEQFSEENSGRIDKMKNKAFKNHLRSVGWLRLFSGCSD